MDPSTQLGMVEESSQSDVDSSDDATTTRNTSGDQEGSTSSSQVKIGKEETTAVNRSKTIVYVCLIIFSIATSMATYVFVASEENSDFETAYLSFAQEIADNANENAELIFGQIRGMASSITSHALDLNQSLPFVTLPHFDLRAQQAGVAAGPELIMFAPIVNEEDVQLWEQYAIEHQTWMEHDLEYRGWNEVTLEDINSREVIFPYSTDKEDDIIEMDIKVPVWQFGPGVIDSSLVGMDLFTHPVFRRAVEDIRVASHDILSEITDLQFLLGYTKDTMNAEYHPRSFIAEPVLEDFKEESKVVGVVLAVEPWERYFINILPNGVNGFVVDMEQSCGTGFTFVINGPNVNFDGTGDRHDPKYNHLAYRSDFAKFAEYDYATTSDVKHCEYTMFVYPSSTFEESFKTSNPIIFAAGVFLIFLFTTLVFFLYDFLVQRRQNKVLSLARRTTAIVTSLFPKEIGKRILEEAEKKEAGEKANKGKIGLARMVNPAKNELQKFLDDGPNEGLTSVQLHTSKPIAEFFPETTIMFADIVGFTAWASSREPSQVFMLLENIYNAFDLVAKRRRVFKVETVGDCYVAVAGLPDPRKDHQTVIARFARDCLYRFSIITKQLEVQLGPGTGDLGLRVGLHSGAVTAGVLRTDNARFQLFGDCMNVAARMEHTGEKGRIQVSQETARCLENAGKGQWVRPRAEKIDVKGKGTMQTYWLDIQAAGSRGTSETSSDHSTGHNDNFQQGSKSNTLGDTLNEQQLRLVDWNVDILSKVLKELVARRQACNEKPDSIDAMRKLEQAKLQASLEEMAECISLPKYDAAAAKKATSLEQDPESIDLGGTVREQLHNYVQGIASMYRDNAFHNFEHASHVTMSVSKLLSRIIAPADLEYDGESDVAKSLALHDHTYGITSDPLTRFAVILSALWHDVDHAGVTNAQLVKETAPVASMYKNRSVAEQNSVELAWSLLMDDQFSDLRRVIYANENEFHRFRQLVLHTVLATDIMDKELGTLRKQRWNDAFAEKSDKSSNANNASDTDEEAKRIATNRRALIVIEHLIQASDVSHTMQHWHIYRKWNSRLYQEMYQAFVEGRADRDPSEFWYQGELGFFDHYIIPLANKLKGCGVFGVSSDEYLTYAKLNREEWEAKGQALVEELKEQVQQTTNKCGV